MQICIDAHSPHPYIHICVTLDKNLDSRQEAFACIPDDIASFQIKPLHMLEHYLKVFRPPTGGFLLTPPPTPGLRPAAFSDKAYAGFPVVYTSRHMSGRILTLQPARRTWHAFPTIRAGSGSPHLIVERIPKSALNRGCGPLGLQRGCDGCVFSHIYSTDSTVDS